MFKNYAAVVERVETLIKADKELFNSAIAAQDKIDELSKYYNQLWIWDVLTMDLQSYCEKRMVDIEKIDDVKLSKWICVYIKKECYITLPW